MTPEEQAVIDAAIKYINPTKEKQTLGTGEVRYRKLTIAVEALEASRQPKIHPDVRELEPGVSVLVSSDGKEWFSGIFIDKFPLAIQVLLTGRRETSYFDYAKPDPNARPAYPWQKATEENRPEENDSGLVKVEYKSGSEGTARAYRYRSDWEQIKRFTYL